jgi:exopolysaccharide biosynthesis polyprenyl glycosylphosphotransferase
LNSSVRGVNTLVEATVGRKLQHSTKRISRRTQRQMFLLALPVVDVLLLLAAFTTAYLIRFYLPLPIFRTGFPLRPDFYLRLVLVLTPLWIAIFWAYRLYDWNMLLGGTREYAAVFNACVGGAVLIALAQFADTQLVIARGWVGLATVLTFLFVITGRFALRRAAYAARRSGYLLSPALIIGGNTEARVLGQQLLAWPTSGINLLGFVDDEAPTGTRLASNLYVLGDLNRLDQLVRQYGIEELVLASSALSREQILTVFRKYGTLPDVNLRLSSGLFDLITTGLQINELASVPLIGINRVRLTRTDVLLKTILDIGLSLVVLVVLAPILLAIAVLVRLDSPGPVLYRRRVMGLNGEQFDALKFRTMRVDGGAILAASPELLDELATTHKIKDDPRITRLGLVLRRFSLDELPQLINVIKRDMSLVGPRMISPPELKNYGNWAMNLLTVRPGLTGLWQVSGRSDVSYEERVQLDMFYIRNYTVWLDLQLILRTVPVVLNGQGAY